MTRATSSTAAATRGHRPRLATAAIIVALAVLAGCSSDASDDAASTTSGPSTTATGATATGGQGHACDREPGAKVTAEPVAGTPSDRTVTSFDGTLIRAHWFPAPKATAKAPAPTILMGPGWSQAGDTSQEKSALFGALGIGGLNERGYNVLTWDPRGFGKSTGRATVNSAEFEGRDVQVLLDWVAEQPEVALDRPGDPRVGMAGWSYGGGIQLITAAIDCRVDVLAPGIAWHSLMTSLGKNQTFKAGWSRLLTETVPAEKVDPHVTEAYSSGKDSGVVSKANQVWFEARGPGDLIDKVDVPTLFIQGTVDTLFTLDEAVTNYRSLRGRKVPVKMLWFCGGHGTCLTDAGDPAAVEDATIAWFEKYLRGDTKVDTGPTVDLIDQDGTRWTGDDYPPATGQALTASGNGRLDLREESAAGATTSKPLDGDMLGGFVKAITPGPATMAPGWKITATDDTLVVGAPKLTLTYKGTTPPGPRPTRLFAQLVDDERNVVVGNQITPIEVTLDGRTHSVTVDLEVIAQYLDAGESLTLQIVATTVAYATPRLGGEVTFDKVEISLPTTTALTRR